MHAEPVAFAVFHDGWIEESTADRNRAEQWAEDGREVVMLYTATPAAEQPYSTTSDKYRAELYDEVWQKARDMGYGNVTEALIALERMKSDTATISAALDEALKQRCRELEVDITTLSDGLRQAVLIGAVAEEERDQLRAEVEVLRRDAELFRRLRDLPYELLGASGVPCVAVPEGPRSGRYVSGTSLYAAMGMEG